jgi:hypothetical protein
VRDRRPGRLRPEDEGDFKFEYSPGRASCRLSQAWKPPDDLCKGLRREVGGTVCAPIRDPEPELPYDE